MVWSLGQLGAAFSQVALAWGGAIAVSIPVAIHLLTRYRRQVQPWGAMRFLAESFKRHKRRLRIEQILLLVNRCLIVLLAGLAMSGPVLTGCTQWIQAATGAGDRVVHVVIDDSIASSATHPAGQQVIDHHKRFINDLAERLVPGDHVVIWRAARSPQRVEPSEPLPPAAVATHLAGIDAVSARADLRGTILAVRRELQRQPRDPRDTFVVLLSAFTRGAVDVERPLTDDLTGLDELATLYAVKPTALGNNAQIAALSLSDTQVLTGAAGALRTLGVQIVIKRFGDTTTTLGSELELAAYSRDRGEPLYTNRVRHEWPSGQNEHTLTLDVPVQALNPRGNHTDTLNPRDIPEAVALLATLIPDAAGSSLDAIAADNQRRGIVCARDTIAVAVVADEALGGPTERQPTSPARWLLSALSPNDQIEAVSAAVLDPTTLSEDALRDFDAAMIVQPEHTTPDAWARLLEYAQRGGVVWVIPPASADPPLWHEPLREAFGVEWQLSIELLAADDEPTRAWRLASADAPPPALRALSTEWESLLRPVRVYRRLDIDRTPIGTDVLLRTADGAPLMITADVGAGSLLLTLTGLDLDWTNLPAKPLFVPLVHETLRTHTARAADRWIARIVSGDAPPADPSRDAPPDDPSRTPRQRWTTWGGPRALNPSNRRAPHTSPSNPSPATGTNATPGIYEATDPAPVRWMVVDPDANGADTTRVLHERLKQWLATAGRWAWLSHDDAANVLTEKTSRTSLGWPLLCAVVGLVLLETCMARWFSHAGVPRLPTASGAPSQPHDRTVGAPV